MEKLNSKIMVNSAAQGQVGSKPEDIELTTFCHQHNSASESQFNVTSPDGHSELNQAFSDFSSRSPVQTINKHTPGTSEPEPYAAGMPVDDNDEKRKYEARLSLQKTVSHNLQTDAGFPAQELEDSALPEIIKEILKHNDDEIREKLNDGNNITKLNNWFIKNKDRQISFNVLERLINIGSPQVIHSYDYTEDDSDDTLLSSFVRTDWFDGIEYVFRHIKSKDFVNAANGGLKHPLLLMLERSHESDFDLTLTGKMLKVMRKLLQLGADPDGCSASHLKKVKGQSKRAPSYILTTRLPAFQICCGLRKTLDEISNEREKLNPRLSSDNQAQSSDNTSTTLDTNYLLYSFLISQLKMLLNFKASVNVNQEKYISFSIIDGFVNNLCSSYNHTLKNNSASLLSAYAFEKFKEVYELLKSECPDHTSEHLDARVKDLEDNRKTYRENLRDKPEDPQFISPSSAQNSSQYKPLQPVEPIENKDDNTEVNTDEWEIIDGNDSVEIVNPDNTIYLTNSDLLKIKSSSTHSEASLPSLASIVLPEQIAILKQGSDETIRTCLKDSANTGILCDWLGQNHSVQTKIAVLKRLVTIQPQIINSKEFTGENSASILSSLFNCHFYQGIWFVLQNSKVSEFVNIASDCHLLVKLFHSDVFEYTETHQWTLIFKVIELLLVNGADPDGFKVEQLRSYKNKPNRTQDRYKFPVIHCLAKIAYKFESCAFASLERGQASASSLKNDSVRKSTKKVKQKLFYISQLHEALKLLLHYDACVTDDQREGVRVSAIDNWCKDLCNKNADLTPDKLSKTLFTEFLSIYNTLREKIPSTEKTPLDKKMQQLSSQERPEDYLAVKQELESTDLNSITSRS